MRFLIVLLIVRALGPTIQGTYYLLVTFNTVALLIASLGIDTASSVFLSKGHYSLSEVNTACVVLAGSLGLLSAGVYYACSPLIHASVLKDVETVYGWFVVLTMPLGLYGVFWRGMMVGLEEIGALNRIELGSVILQLVLLILMLKLGYGLVGALLAWGAGLLAVAIAGARAVAGKGMIRWHFNSQMIREAVQFGVASQWGEIARMLVLRSDVFLLNLLAGPEVVSYYSVALSLTEKLWIAYTSLYRAATRRLQALSREQAAKLLARITRGTTFLVLVAASGLGVISPWLLPALFGPQYAKSVVPFVILLISLAPYGVWAGIRIYITGQLYRPHLTSLIQWMALLVSVVLYYFLIRLFGVVGAALGSTLSYSILCVMGLFVLHRSVPLYPLEFFVIRKDELLSYGRLGLERVMQFAGKV
jgi:O-antigen/teichoic acid export membrane protein